MDPSPVAVKTAPGAAGLGARMPSWSAKALPLAALAVAMALGLLVRLRYVLAVDFPLNDGGLFYIMARDIQQARYILPAYTSYNDASIPFAYPPFGFYLAALLEEITPGSLLDMFRFLPLIANMLTIPAFFLLARAMVPSRMTVALAVIIFALLPRSFLWLIMGGGLTRSLGFLFALLAIHQAYLLYTRRQSRYAWWTAILAGLTALSHPEIGWFLVFSLAILFLGYGRHREGARSTARIVGVFLLMTAPWWATILTQHGPAPLLAGAQTGEHSWDSWRALIYWHFTEQPLVNWSGVMGLLGVFAAIANGQLFLPVWLGAMLLLEPRSAATYATVPLAMLIAIFIKDRVFPFWRRATPTSLPVSFGRPFASGRGAERLREQAQGLLPKLAVLLFLAYLATVSLWGAQELGRSLGGLSPAERTAMAWVAENTPEDSRFLVITGESWWGDRTSEWFPALTGRGSLATVQGYEWFGRKEFYDHVKRFDALQWCNWQMVGCLEYEAGQAGLGFTHVYVSQSCCKSLRASLRGSADYTLVYDEAAAAIFHRRPWWIPQPQT